MSADAETRNQTAPVEVYGGSDGNTYAVVDHRPDLPIPFSGELQRWARERFDPEAGEKLSPAGVMLYTPLPDGHDAGGRVVTFPECLHDERPLIPMADDPALPDHIEPLECPTCGEVYLLDRETGSQEVDGA